MNEREKEVREVEPFRELFVRVKVERAVFLYPLLSNSFSIAFQWNVDREGGGSKRGADDVKKKDGEGRSRRRGGGEGSDR